MVCFFWLSFLIKLPVLHIKVTLLVSGLFDLGCTRFSRVNVVAINLNVAFGDSTACSYWSGLRWPSRFICSLSQCLGTSIVDSAMPRKFRCEEESTTPKYSWL